MESLGVGCSSTDVISNHGKDESISVSNATEGSCSSQSYSTADSSNQGQNSDSEIDLVPHSTRVSSVVATDCVVDIDRNEVDEVRISVEKMEKECRICMLSLDSESGIAIVLGCSCKNELAAVHQHCAETWFTSKGNRICEICKSIAQNVVMPKSTESSQRIFEVSRSLTNAASFQEVEVITVSRRSDIEPESSTSVSEQVWLILGICLFIGMVIYPIGDHFISRLLH